MAAGWFAPALIAFHLALFTAIAFFAREQRVPGRIAAGVAAAFLGLVVWDLVADPSQERFGGLAMGLTFMFTILWLSAANLFTAIAVRGAPPTGVTAWFLKRARYWVMSGSVGAVVSGGLWPRLRGPVAEVVPAWGGLVAAGLGVAAVLTVWLRVRAAAATAAENERDEEERVRAARQAARATWRSLSLGVAAVLVALLTRA